MGFVAELQQIDPLPTAPDRLEPAPAEPSAALTAPGSPRPETDPQPTDRYAALAEPRFLGRESADDDTVEFPAASAEAARGPAPIDITPGALTAPPSTAGMRRRLRAAMLTSAAVAALVAGGVGYAALSKPDAIKATPGQSPSAPGSPATGGPTGGAPAAAGVDRIGRSTSPPVSAGSTTAGNPSAPTRAAAATTSVQNPGGVRAAETQPIAPPGESESTPPVQAQPAPGSLDPPPGQGGRRPLTATFTHTADIVDGILWYAGTIRVDNPARRPANGWQVTLFVPGGNQVYADGVALSQVGEQVTFTPYDDAATLPARGTVTFTFTIHGLLPAEPSSCAVNGRACQ
jgi:hypothetical protein